jgi:hypothetical protein
MAICTLVACRQRSAEHNADPDLSDDDTLSHSAFHPVQLAGHLILSDPVIGKPSHMFVDSGTLWVTDGSGNPFVHVVDLTSKRVVLSYGAKGDGPGDFASIQDLSARPGAVEPPWAFDGRLDRLTRLAGRSGVDTRVSTIQPPETLRPLRLIWLTHDMLLALGELDSNRIILADSTGRPLRIVKGGLLGGDSIPIQTRSSPSSGIIVCDAAGPRRFAVLFIGAGRIDLYDYSGSLLTRATVPFASNGSFERDSAGTWHARLPNRRYYGDCAATSAFLYALFSGHRTDSRPGGGVVIEAAYLHVFDWSGRLQGVIHLDHNVSAVAIEGDSVLYGASSDSGDILRYSLPGSFGRPRRH